jgi:hypothetical protein
MQRMLEAVLIGVTAAVTRELMTDGMILSFWDKTIGGFPDWLYKPLGGCLMCFAGQLGFWYYLFTGDYNLFTHIGFITLSIFTAVIAEKLMNYGT